MYIKKLSNVGGMSSLQRYANMLSGNTTFISTTTTDIALAINGSPYISAYPWSQGFGTKYADPASLPGFYGYDVNFSPNGSSVVLSDYYGFSAYPWSSGFGSKYANPASAPGGPLKSNSFSTDGTTIFGGNATSPYIHAYPWSPGFGTKYADPASLPAGGLYGVESIDYGSNTVFMSSYATPYLAVYPWSSGFGTKYANPATLPNSGYSVSYNSTASLVAFGQSTGAYSPAVYPWSAGFGTKYADTTFSNSAFGSSATSFNNDGTAIISAYSYTGSLTAWPWSSGFGTKYATPSTYTGTASDTRGVSVSKDGKQVAITGSVSPYVFVYYFTSASGFGFKYANPTTLPSGTVPSAAFR